MLGLLATGVAWQLSRHDQEKAPAIDVSDSVAASLHKKTQSATRVNQDEPLQLPDSDACDPMLTCILDPLAPLPERGLMLRKLELGAMTPQQQLALQLAYENPKTDLEWAWKNDVIQCLARTAPDTSLAADSFKAVLHDQGRDPVIREYTLQYMHEFLGRLDPSQLSSKEMALFKTMVELLHDSQPTIAGGALIALSRLPATFPKGNLNLTAEALLLLNQGSHPDRIAAAQCLGKLGGGQEQLRTLVMDDSAPEMLRAASLHALVTLRDPSVDKLASQLLEDRSNEILCRAALSARRSTTAASLTLLQPVK
ncbi:MAG: hypothetical protein RL095_238 [Verrucomicrobiota bacterium]